jgi:hypothetical protein
MWPLIVEIRIIAEIKTPDSGGLYFRKDFYFRDHGPQGEIGASPPRL